jgi:CubicO group peptidase (beta-lactamase class C family)
MAKALVGGTSLLVAISDGRLSPFDRAVKYIPAWANDAKKSKITIRQLASHTSGIEDSSVSGIAHGKEPAWKGQFWRREPDPFSVSVQSAPVIFEPGTGYQYSNPGMALLAYAVTASLRGTPQTDIRTLLRDRVFRELGIPDEAWSIGYGKPYQVDGLDLYANWGGGTFTARATARIGEWMMHLGKWEGKQLIREAVARQAVAYSGLPLPARTPEDKYGPGSGSAARCVRRSGRAASGDPRGTEPGTRGRAQWWGPRGQGRVLDRGVREPLRARDESDRQPGQGPAAAVSSQRGDS